MLNTVAVLFLLHVRMHEAFLDYLVNVLAIGTFKIQWWYLFESCSNNIMFLFAVILFLFLDGDCGCYFLLYSLYVVSLVTFAVNSSNIMSYLAFCFFLYVFHLCSLPDLIAHSMLLAAITASLVF